MNITASLQIKNNIYQVVLNYKDINGKRKQKWFSTGLSQKGNNISFWYFVLSTNF